MHAYHRGVAAILGKIGAPVDMCIGHKEWAPHRKCDPDFDMVAFRDEVQAIMNGTVAIPPPTPLQDAQGHPTLLRDSTGEEVKLVQEVVGVPVDGRFGPQTEAAVRKFQTSHELVPDGRVGPKTWPAILIAAVSHPA